MLWLRKEHYEALNSTKDNDTTEIIEELERLRQILEDKKGDMMKIGEEQDMLMKKN